MSEARENFVKMAYIVVEMIPNHFRTLFTKQWNKTYPDKVWQSNAKSGLILNDHLGYDFKKDMKKNKNFIDKIKTGNEKEWDTTTLAKVLLHSDLNLIQEDNTRKGISQLVDIRYNDFAHLSSASIPADKFEEMIEIVKTSVRNLLGEGAEDEIDQVVRLQQAQDGANIELRTATNRESKTEGSQALQKGKRKLVIYFIEFFVIPAIYWSFYAQFCKYCIL